FAPPQPMMRAAMAEADGMSGGETYQPGLIRIEAMVTAAFELEP
ncbi:oxidative stress defense protein, partial [Thioalkalivibrio sp. XN8]|nr:oxidative stress defense protein [Thioalkalivibrio sp. XN8]